MFQLNREEHDVLRSQTVISKPGRGGRRYRPYAFTEQGVAMLSSVLHSERAVTVNIEIMRAFVELRRAASSYAAIEKRLEELERETGEGSGCPRTRSSRRRPVRAKRRPTQVGSAESEPLHFWRHRGAFARGDLRPASLVTSILGQRGTDLLLETPYGPLPPHFEEHLLESSALAGYRILLAHPERSPSFQSAPERLAELVRRGVLVQITVGSLAESPRRSRSARLAHDLLREGLAHVIASDAHSAEGAVRAPEWGALKAARDLIGSSRVEWMVEAAPRAILDGTRLPPAPPPTQGGKTRRWRLGRGR